MDEVDLEAKTPAGTVALKESQIGEGMDVEVAVNWDKRQTEVNAEVGKNGMVFRYENTCARRRRN